MPRTRSHSAFADWIVDPTFVNFFAAEGVSRHEREKMEKRELLLIARAQKNDASAFREIVEKYKHLVYSFACDLTGNRHDAEDLCQEVFIKAYLSLAAFRAEAKLSSWLFKIAINTNINKKRKKALSAMRLIESFNDQKSEHDPFSAEAYSQNPERSAQSRMIQDHLDRALDCLATRERAVFTLRHYQDLPLKEIAEILNIAEGTVKSLLFRALKRLRKELLFYEQDLGLEE